MKIKDLINSEFDLADFSDKDLYHLCKEYGNGIKILRRIFAVLLVEVFRRNLHRKYGFESIYEFGAKIGGMNRELVQRVLWLANALKDKPFLWLEFKKEGWSKVRVVASVATAETDKFWAEKVSMLSKPALEVLVQDWRKKDGQKKLCKVICSDSKNFKNLTNSLFNAVDYVPKNDVGKSDLPLPKPQNQMVPNFGDTFVSIENENNFVKMRFKVLKETEFKFLLFKQKLCKKKKEALTSGEVLAFLLDCVEGLKNLR